MSIKFIKNPISRQELALMAKNQFGDLIKIAVDVGKEIMAVGGEFHSDEELLLMEKQDSKRENVWGVNLYPEKSREKWIEFDSMINLKPFCNNRSRGVESAGTRKKIKEIIGKLILN